MRWRRKPKRSTPVRPSGPCALALKHPNIDVDARAFERKHGRLPRLGDV